MPGESEELKRLKGDFVLVLEALGFVLGSAKVILVLRFFAAYQIAAGQRRVNQPQDFIAFFWQLLCKAAA